MVKWRNGFDGPGDQFGRGTPQPALALGPGRDPGVAAMLSVVPGLGQLYNRQSRKGLLFIDVAAVNLFLVALVLFAEPLLKALESLKSEHHFALNAAMMNALHSARVGSPFSLAVLVLCAAFVAYAVRDAYDTAHFNWRKQIYADAFVEMSEAASGSYLFHAASMVVIAILAMFFLVPQAERRQITEIEFLAQPNQKAPIRETHVRAEKQSQASARPKEGPPKMPSQTQHQQAANRPAPRPDSQLHPVPRPAPEAPQTPHMPVPQPMARVNPVTPHVMPMPAAPAPLAQAARVTPTPTPAVAPRAAASAPLPQPASLMPRGAAAFTPGPAPVQTAVGAAGIAAPVAPLPNASVSKSSAFAAPGPVAASSPAGASNSAPVKLPAGTAPASASDHRLAPAAAPAPHRSSGSGNSPTQVAMVTPAALPSSGGGKPVAGAHDSPSSDFSGRFARDGREPGLDAKQEVDFSLYMAQLERRIKRAWMPSQRPRSNSVKLFFKVSEVGELSNLRLSKSSGDALIDQAALDAVRRAAPFGPLPKGAPPDVDIEFTFDYHVFDGGGAHGAAHF